MSYHFFDVSDMVLEDWIKVFEFCLKKSDFFHICHIHHYDNMDRKDKVLFDVNGAKTEQLWHFDYNFEYISVDEDEMNEIQNLYQKVLDTSDFVYLRLPADSERAEFLSFAQKSASFTMKRNMSKGKEYYEISGVVNEESKRALTEAAFLNNIQTVDSKWRYELYKNDCLCGRFCAAKNYVGFLLDSEELKTFEEKRGELSNKRLSNVFVCGKIREELFDLLMNLFSTSPYEAELPFFGKLALMKEQRQLLYYDFDELLVCLSDSEISEMGEEYQIDIKKCKLLKEQSAYHVPEDCFGWSAYDLERLLK